MNSSSSIMRLQTVFGHPSAGSGLVRARHGRRLRRARPRLDPLEERCLLSFGSPSLFDNGTGTNNEAVAIGYIFGDSYPDGSPILDLVTATASGALSMAQGNGDGTFKTPINVATPATSFSAVALANLGGNNGLDIIAADQKDSGGELWVFLNQGNGTFTTASYDPILVAMPGPTPVAMAVAGAPANLNGNTMADLDGHTLGQPHFAADIVIANPADNNVIVLPGNGNGTFKAPAFYTVGSDPVNVALGDFDNDGYPDILTANEKGNSVSVLLGNGDGTFQPRMDIPITVPALPVGDKVDSSVSNPMGVAVGDFNGDGNLDFATANGGWASVNVVLGNGNGTFGAQQTISTLTYYSDTADPLNPDPPSAIVAGDLDGDGFVDIAVTEPRHDAIGVLDGNGDGSFATRVDYPAGESPSALVIGNLNGGQTSLGLDRLDLVAVDPSETQFSVLIGQKFTTTTTLGLNLSTITWGGSVQLTPAVTPGYVSQQLPLTGSYQLIVDGVDHGVPQPLSSTYVLSGLPVGQHKLAALFLGDENFQESTTTTTTVTVVPALLTVAAIYQTRPYGAADPTFTYSITGFVNGDVFEQSEVKGAPLFTSTDSALSSVAGG